MVKFSLYLRLKLEVRSIIKQINSFVTYVLFYTTLFMSINLQYNLLLIPTKALKYFMLTFNTFYTNKKKQIAMEIVDLALDTKKLAKSTLSRITMPQLHHISTSTYTCRASQLLK